ncbi:MAG TPA: ATP-binding protein [Chloroflexota bacterium]|nr:ATP-binding protein [Chloroflexota bacterium]
MSDPLSAPAHAPQVLVVDDDANLRRLVRDNLVLEGMDVHVAADVPAARAALVGWTPDLIVLDVMLPGASGFDFCRELSADPALRDVPVLFLSARVETEDKIAGLGLGAVDYLGKPFDPAELVARCQAALRARARARASAQAELDQFKDQVLTLVGHELRTPLSLVLGYAELLRARGDDLSPDKVDGFLREIASGSTRLARLLEDVLLLVAPAPQLQRLDLRGPVAQAVRVLTPRFEQQRVTLAYEPPPAAVLVRGATLALTAAVRHLLDNAAAFSPAGGCAEATLAAAGAEARFTVTDQGPGIAREQQDQIFERFYQVSQGLNRKHGGLGIGLAIVRHVATLHGGYVTVESAPGAGSRFTLSLPLATPSAGARARAGEDA